MAVFAKAVTQIYTNHKGVKVLWHISTLPERLSVSQVPPALSGSYMAKVFAKNGANVAVLGNNVEKGKAVADEIKKDGGKAEFFPFNVCDDESIKTGLKNIADTFGGIDIWINNAESTFPPRSVSMLTNSPTNGGKRSSAWTWTAFISAQSTLFPISAEEGLKHY